MEAYLLDWANLLLRWAHVIVAIAWIGSSFYFVFLDNSLTKPEAPDLKAKGVDGELWAVHGGGFYNPQKYMVAPPQLPKNLHWFYWESYSTWLTGFALFTVMYLYQASTFLIDKNLHDWTPTAAVAKAVRWPPSHARSRCPISPVTTYAVPTAPKASSTGSASSTSAKPSSKLRQTTFRARCFAASDAGSSARNWARGRLRCSRVRASRSGRGCGRSLWCS